MSSKAKSKMARLPKDMRVDAETLARFADLEPAQAEEFRHTVAPGFLPEGFWIAKGLTSESPNLIPDWVTEQKRLREAWREGFPLTKAVELISGAAKLSELSQWFLQAADSRDGMPVDEHGVPLDPPKPDSYPYQHIIMLLALQPWRAQICAVCGHHFVKEVQRDRYCSTGCSKEAIRRQHNRWWKDNRAKD